PLHGAEVRFGSTFGPTDPCTCGHRYAWELAYWALDDQSSDAWLRLSDPVGSGNPLRIYGTLDKRGLQYDIDGGGIVYDPSPADEYYDNGVPADGDVSANDVRILAFRVRRRFSAQNLELNFWRFGSPECQTPLLAGALGGSAGCGDGCYGGAPCKPARPPRRFFINGQAGVRYFRVDDDLGLDTQFTLVDGAGDVVTGGAVTWNDSYTSFPADEIGVLIEDIETNNELVGLQLGCSMNYLIGCKWNLFADTNFGIYGNNADVYQRLVVGGPGAAAYTESGGEFSSVRYSASDVAFLGELRTGVAYQLTCNCRLSAAYRFIGAGGLALSHSQIPSNYANENIITHVNADDSLILHGLQLGAEFKY
ncbi:MAG: BBP7 family outer membrane beta-barrel protein, partial [Planctomycetota bacterium]